MNSKGFFSRDFLVQFFGLIVSIAAVFSVYSSYVWPKADNIELSARIQAIQNPEEPFEANRSIVVIMKDNEQMLCLMLMMWALIIIVDKFLRIRSEAALNEVDFLGISRGERIIPEEALVRYKDVEAMVKRTPSMRGRILPDVILAALHRFGCTQSIQDAASSVEERVGVFYAQMESDLSLLRYIAWAIPSFGFIGTVRGIGEALAYADKAIKGGDISDITASLGLAFNSTLIALVLSIVLMFLLHALQTKNEGMLIEVEDLASKKVVALMKTPTNETPNVSYT